MTAAIQAAAEDRSALTAMPSTLDAALDELYGSDPGDFVATRKRLVAGLRAGGDKSAAKELQTARRPSTSAWALNQLARRDPELVGALLERSRDLAAAQTRALSGKPDAMRAAISGHRGALGEVTDASVAILDAEQPLGVRSQGESARTCPAPAH